MDGGGELFVGLWNFDTWEMWCGLGSLELAVLYLPDAKFTGECRGSAGGDAAIAFDDEINFFEMMLLHPQQRGADGADVVTNDIQRSATALHETCPVGEVALLYW